MRILLIDDHTLLRELLAEYLADQPDLDVEIATTLSAARSALANGAVFDLVILEYDMPGMVGLAALEEFRARAPATQVVILSQSTRLDIAEAAVAAGACGFLPKNITPDTLLHAIRRMAAGEYFAPDAFLTKDPIKDHPLAALLTQRELEVLYGLVCGQSNKQIARDLDIREPTVKLHVKTLYRKVGASNRTQAAMIAKQQGLF